MSDWVINTNRYPDTRQIVILAMQKYTSSFFYLFYQLYRGHNYEKGTEARIGPPVVLINGFEWTSVLVNYEGML